MDSLYSGTLLLSFAASGAAFAILLLRRPTTMPDLRQALVLVLATLALLLATISTMIHFLLGHGADSAEPMRGLAFVAAHPANLTALLLALLPAIAGVVMPRR